MIVRSHSGREMVHKCRKLTERKPFHPTTLSLSHGSVCRSRKICIVTFRLVTRSSNQHSTMAPKPTETSPLLPSKLQDPLASASSSATSSSERQQRVTRRALFVVLPLAALALVGLGWLFAGANDNDDDSSDVAIAPKLRNTGGESYSDDELLALLPPFVSRKHPIPPKVIDRATFAGAIPTNAFWTNLLVGDDHGLNPGVYGSIGACQVCCGSH